MHRAMVTQLRVRRGQHQVCGTGEQWPRTLGRYPFRRTTARRSTGRSSIQDDTPRAKPASTSTT